MCPNSQDPSRLTATSVMSYKAVTASKPKQLPEAPRKGTAYRATKKLDKNNNDWHINNEHYNITHKFNQFTNNSTLITHNNTHHLTNTTHTTTNTNINTITKDIKDITVIEGEGANTKETPFGGTLGPSTVMEDKDFSVYSFNSNYSVTGSGPTNSTTSTYTTTTSNTTKVTEDPDTVGPSTVTEGKGANSMPMECTNSSINTKDFGDTIKEQNMYMNIRDHAVLTEEELATFRTSFCTKHHQNKCPNSDSCEKSHCLTWQRRNPYEISYCPHLCPNIQFVKKSRKMVLYRRCTRGKNCNFAHSKEEELYHPLVYKTKQCSSYPKCSRYFCPFIHEPHELRDISRFKNSSVTVTGSTATCSTLTGTGPIATVPSDSIPPPKVTTTTGKGANSMVTECTSSTKEAPFGAGTLGTTGAVGPSTVTEEEKEKVEMIETSFEFDCLDTINGQDTFRDGFTNNSFESNSTKDNLDHLIKSPNKSNIWDKNEEMENVMWYDLPNLNMNVYDDSLKPLYEPFNSYYSSINPYNTTINSYNTINPYINIPNTIPNNVIPNNMNIGMDIGYTYENYHDEQYYTNYPNLSSTINNKNKKKISSSVTVTGPPNSNGPDTSTNNTTNSNDSKDTSTVGSSTVTMGKGANSMVMECTSTNGTGTKDSTSKETPFGGTVGASTVTDTVTEENYYSYDYYKSYNNYQLKQFPDYKPYTEDYKGYTEDYKGYTEDYKGYTEDYKGYTEEYKPYADDYKGYTDEYKGYREEYGFVDNMGFVDNIGFVEDYKGYYDYETYQMNPMDPVNSMNQMDTNYQMDSNYSMNQMNPMDPVNSMNQMESNYSNNYSYDFGTDYVQYNTQELDEQFNNLNVKDDYSFNDMLVKFINEIGDK